MFGPTFSAEAMDKKGEKTPANSTPAGRVFKVERSDLHIYVLSWWLKEIDGLELIPKTHTLQAYGGRILHVPFHLHHPYCGELWPP